MTTGVRNHKMILMVIGLAIAAFAMFLVFKGGSGGEVTDARGDVAYSAGEPGSEGTEQTAAAAAVADVVTAKATREGSEIIFQATAAAPIPERFEDASLEYRWDISASGQGPWIVAATVDIGVNGAVVSQTTDYGSGTIDGSMPGRVALENRTVSIWVDFSEIPGFPDHFQWRLSTTLNVDRRDPDSPRVGDRAPDEGAEELAS